MMQNRSAKLWHMKVAYVALDQKQSESNLAGGKKFHSQHACACRPNPSRYEQCFCLGLVSSSYGCTTRLNSQYNWRHQVKSKASVCWPSSINQSEVTFICPPLLFATLLYYSEHCCVKLSHILVDFSRKGAEHFKKKH